MIEYGKILNLSINLSTILYYYSIDTPIDNPTDLLIIQKMVSATIFLKINSLNYCKFYMLIPINKFDYT